MVICLYAALIINEELGIRPKKNNFSAKDICSKEMSKMIVLLHAMTECDVTIVKTLVKLKLFWHSSYMQNSINML